MEKSIIALVLALIVALVCCASAETADPTLVETSNGLIQGFTDEARSLYIWQNVPYGTAPLGELRWKAPIPAQPWEGVYNATVPSNVATQYSKWAGQKGSEDCLNLEIYRPANDHTDLPVIVHLHGGNNQTGSASQVDVPQFANAADCVIVSLNHRLNLLGFNSLPALKTGNSLEDSGNYTMLDIALALDWVKENIGAFGGDGNNITVTGSSAGGRNVMAMLISPIFKGKFQKAISYSGGMTTSNPEDGMKVIASRLAPLAVEDGKAATEKEAYEWLLTDGEDVREYLYAMDDARMIMTFGDASIRMAHFPHHYTDGIVIPKEGFATDSYNAVPIIMFTGTNEFSMFATSNYFPTLDKESEDYKAQIAFVNKYGGMLYELFNAEESAQNMKHAYDAPIYLLSYNGAGHTAQRHLLGPSKEGGGFGGVSTDQDIEMSPIYLGYLYNFLRTGNPNGGDLPVWDQWSDDVSKPNTIFFDGLSGEHGQVSMANRRISYDDVLAQMDADTTITPEQKQAIISQSMNGRWFSAKLDAHYNNASLWDVAPTE